MDKRLLIRKIYLYFFALIGLVLLVIGFVRLVSLALKTYVFTRADIYYVYPVPRPLTSELQEPSPEEIEDYQNKERISRRQREAAESLALIIVGFPLYLYHWGIIRKERKEGEIV